MAEERKRDWSSSTLQYKRSEITPPPPPPPEIGIPLNFGRRCATQASKPLSYFRPKRIMIFRNPTCFSDLKPKRQNSIHAIPYMQTPPRPTPHLRSRGVAYQHLRRMFFFYHSRLRALVIFLWDSGARDSDFASREEQGFRRSPLTKSESRAPLSQRKITTARSLLAQVKKLQS